MLLMEILHDLMYTGGPEFIWFGYLKSCRISMINSMNPSRIATQKSGLGSVPRSSGGSTPAWEYSWGQGAWGLHLEGILNGRK